MTRVKETSAINALFLPDCNRASFFASGALWRYEQCGWTFLSRDVRVVREEGRMRSSAREQKEKGRSDAPAFSCL